MKVDEEELSRIYRRRFADTAAYRKKVWSVLTAKFFPTWVNPDHDVLDLGCGYGEFINQIRCGRKWAMDLNPDARGHLDGDIAFLEQDCSQRWELDDESLDAVFTSNFFEHLPDKACLTRTLAQALRCLRPGGRLIAVGPNIKVLPGLYWDFFDHHTILTETSLGEALEISGFSVERAEARFLPYTMVGAREVPLSLVSLYLKLPWAWRFLGKQFLVIARKG